VVLVACVTGCSPSTIEEAAGSSTSGEADTTSTADSTSSAATTVVPTTSSTETTAVADTTSSESTTGAPAGCGNGVVEGLEHCDGGDDCTAECTLPSGTAIWRIELDNGDDDTFVDVGVDAAGRLLALGSRRGETGWDSWLVRFDATGEMSDETVLDLGEGDDDRAQGLASLGVGLVVVGFASQPGVEDEDDALVVGLDADLTTLWAERVDHGLDDSALAVAVTPGAIAVGGTAEDPSEFLNAWFAVYDISGALQWEQAVDGPGGRNDEIRGVAWLDDGSLAIVGNQYATDDTDLFIAVREPNGSARWSERLDFDFGDDAATSVRAVPDGLLVGGNIASALTNSDELWVARFGLDGTPGAVVSYNSNGFVFDGAQDALATDEHVYVAGVVSRPEEQRNALVGRWPASGAAPDARPDWTDSFDGGPGLADAAHALVQLADGSIVAVGETTVLGQGTNAWIGRWAP
jgi:hypothetical protein